MLEWILAAVGLVGFGLAGYWDAKSTEFPDWLPYSMIILALAARGVFAFLLPDWGMFMNSVAAGLAFLALGLSMYLLRQWGDGDAWLLGALGFLLPGASSLRSGVFPFPVAVLFNFFLAALIYIIAYSLLLSLRKPYVRLGFIRSMRREYKGAVMATAGASAAYFAFLLFMFLSFGLAPPSPLFVAAFPVLIAFMVVFLHYGIYIEKNLFKKRIPVSRLRVGDVHVGRKWRVLRPDEVRVLKRRGGFVWIKEGIRFAPVFFITLLVTLLFGDVFSLIFGL